MLRLRVQVLQVRSACGEPVGRRRRQPPALVRG